MPGFLSRQLFWKSLFSTLLLCLVLSAAGASVEALKMQVGGNWRHLLALFIPSLPLVLPISALVGPWMGLSLWRHDGGALAVASAGLPPSRLLAPLFGVGLLLALGHFLAMDKWAPQAQKILKSGPIATDWVIELTQYTPQTLHPMGGGLLIYPHTQNGEATQYFALLHQPSLWGYAQGIGPQVVDGQLHFEELAWAMQGPSLTSLNAPNSGALNDINVPLHRLMPQKTRGPAALETWELEKRIEKMEAQGHSAFGERAALKRRYLSPLLTLISPLIAIPLALGPATALLSAGGLTALFTLLILGNRLAEVLGAKGQLSPTLSALLPLILALIWGFLAWQSLKRGPRGARA